MNVLLRYAARHHVAPGTLDFLFGAGETGTTFRKIAGRLGQMRRDGLFESTRQIAGIASINTYWRLTPAGREAVRS